MTAAALIVWSRHGLGSAARREAAAAHAAQPLKRSASGSIPTAPRITRLGPESFRGQLPARSAFGGAPPEEGPPGLDDIDDGSSRSCGGDMSTPQKMPSYQALSADDFR